MEGTKFLEQRYKLNADPAVEAASRHTKRATGKNVPQNPDSRIENYLDRLDHIFNPPPLEGHPDFDRQSRNLAMLKPRILDRFVTRFEDIPESYWRGQEKILRERGQQGDYNRFSDEDKNKWKKELTEGLLNDQRASLEQWIDYLSSPNIVTSDGQAVPPYVRHWIFRSVVGLSEYDKEKAEFPERSKGTVKMFPDINEEALAYVMDALIKRHSDLPPSFPEFDAFLSEAEIDELKGKFKKGLEKENFGKLYAWANEQIRPIPEHLLPVTDGSWIKYDQGSDHKPLVASIRGKGTGWCTAGESYAMNQLKEGDFYVFYSNDDNGNPVNPRIAIRMEGEQIAEVRGIAPKQNLDPFMGDVLEAKLDEFPDKDEYLKKERDMKKLTEIDNKVKAGQDLGTEDLIFLYELDSPIEGFGNEDDPRIAELRDSRDPEEDMSIVFNCEPSQIARSAGEVNADTKAFVGKLEPGIFDKIRQFDIEHVYTSFPEGRIRFEVITIGGKSKKELKSEIKDAGIDLYGSADAIMSGMSFTTLLEEQDLELVRLKPQSLGIGVNQSLSVKEIIEKARILGLDLLPAEAGPHYRLKYNHSERATIVMKPIVFKTSWGLLDGTSLFKDWSPSVFLCIANGLTTEFDGNLDAGIYGHDLVLRLSSDSQVGN